MIVIAYDDTGMIKLKLCDRAVRTVLGNNDLISAEEVCLLHILLFTLPHINMYSLLTNITYRMRNYQMQL